MQLWYKKIFYENFFYYLQHLLQDIIYVETLPAYLSLVRRPRREYLCWDNKNGEKISLLEPTLSICLSPRDIYRNKYSAILKVGKKKKIADFILFFFCFCFSLH